MAEFEVQCACGKKVNANFFYNTILEVEPCEACLATAKAEGYQQKEDEG